MWQKDTADVNGDGRHTSADQVNWCAAPTYCENLSFAGNDDWRLPNVRELQSIVDSERFNPSIDPVFSALPLVYWSSTSYSVNPDCAWDVGFDDGDVTGIGVVKSGSHTVRAVRSGP
jgi:hypothetical protein